MDLIGGRYRLLDAAGVGGMAIVWRAHDEVLDRTVAVKLLTDDQCADPREIERARTEARYGARLAHPNVAAVYDFGTSRRGGRGAAYVVMELLDGRLLSDHLDRAPLSWRFAARVCAELSAGLAAAHSQGIVHRDIKPANVVLTESGAKLLDFGIAARVGEVDQLPDGTVLGTSGYMAPERFGPDPLAPSVDMYGLGVLLYRALGAEIPIFAHLPLILGADKSRLSKRHGATDVNMYRTEGFLPEAFRNFLALLGWSPGGDEEFLRTSQLLEKFSLEGVSRVNGVFDRPKLEWFNTQYLQKLPIAELLPYVEAQLKTSKFWKDEWAAARRGAHHPRLAPAHRAHPGGARASPQRHLLHREPVGERAREAEQARLEGARGAGERARQPARG